MLLSVPGAKSSLGFPATVTRPGLDGCLNWRWLPRVATKNHPSLWSMSNTSPTFISRVGDEEKRLIEPDIEIAEFHCLIPIASDIGILGLKGFTLTRCRAGSITRSMSSIGIAPSNTWFPKTKAPVMQSRPSISMRTGPT